MVAGHHRSSSRSIGAHWALDSRGSGFRRRVMESGQSGLVVGRHFHAGGSILPFATELLPAEKPGEEEENLEEIFAKPEKKKKKGGFVFYLIGHYRSSSLNCKP